MGAAAGTQAGGGDGVQFVAAARKLLVENPDMEYEAVLKALGPLPPGVTVNESAVERVRALAESSETDAKLWDVVVAAMNEKQSSGKSSRMTQKLDADGFKNIGYLAIQAAQQRYPPLKQRTDDLCNSTLDNNLGALLETYGQEGIK